VPAGGVADPVPSGMRPRSLRPATSTGSGLVAALGTRYDKTATSYQGMIDLATLLIWL
jgi:hypothetical protein